MPRALSSLTCLDIRGNDITATGVTVLASARFSPGLQTLGVGENALEPGAESAKALASLVSRCSSLTSLDLGGMQLHTGCSVLFDALAQCTFLTQLSLSQVETCACVQPTEKFPMCRRHAANLKLRSVPWARRVPRTLVAFCAARAPYASSRSRATNSQAALLTPFWLESGRAGSVTCITALDPKTLVPSERAAAALLTSSAENDNMELLSLDISRNPFGEVGSAALCGLLKSPTCALQALYVAETRLFSSGCAKALQAGPLSFGAAMLA